MLVSHTMQLNGLKKRENELLVHIYPTVLEARKYKYTSLNLAIKYNYDALYVRKAASMYGWDIMPRMVSAGIWRGVRIFREQPLRLLQAYLYTVQAEESRAALNLFYEVELQREPASDFEVLIEARCGEHIFTGRTRVWGKKRKNSNHGGSAAAVVAQRIWRAKPVPGDSPTASKRCGCRYAGV